MLDYNFLKHSTKLLKHSLSINSFRTETIENQEIFCQIARHCSRASCPTAMPKPASNWTILNQSQVLNLKIILSSLDNDEKMVKAFEILTSHKIQKELKIIQVGYLPPYYSGESVKSTKA